MMDGNGNGGLVSDRGGSENNATIQPNIQQQQGVAATTKKAVVDGPAAETTAGTTTGTVGGLRLPGVGVVTDGGSQSNSPLQAEVFPTRLSCHHPTESASATSSSTTTTPGSLGGSSAAEVPMSSSSRLHQQQPPPMEDSMSGNNRGNSSSSREQQRQSSCAIKLLVSNNAAGSIIGRAGQTISELQNESGSRIKLSQAGDYYPGSSQDRVCLVQGDREAVKTGLRLLLERLYMMQETLNTPAWHQYNTRAGSSTGSTNNNNTVTPAHFVQQQQQPQQTVVFDFVIRLLVPVTCCGMIIGKNGANIKYMEEASGVTSVRLSPKEDGIYAVTMERIVTITGTALPGCISCVFLIVDGMTAHPDISRYGNLTTSYVNTTNASMPAALYSSGNNNSTTAASSSAPNLAIPRQQQQPTLLLHQPPSPNATRRAFWDPSIIVPSHQQSSGISRRSISSPDLLAASTGTHQHQQQQQHVLQQQHHHHHHRTALPQRQPSPEQTYRELGVDGLSLLYGSFPSLHVPHPPAAMPQESQQQQPLLLRNSLFEGHPFDFGGMAHTAQQQQDHGMMQQLAPSPSLTSTVSHSASAPNLLLAAQFEQSLHISSSQSPTSLSQQTTTHRHSQHHHHQSPALSQHEYDNNAPTLVPQAPILIAPGCYTAQVLVPDSMIGSILGRGGRTLNELQMMSGTRIRISQRGEYMPGTRSRIVGIRGPTAQAVWDVQYMIGQRMVLPPTATAANAAYHMPASVSFDNLQQLTGRTNAEDGSSSRGLHYQ